MIPILFDSNAQEFTTKGIGELTDALSCVCNMADLQYELTLEYPVDGDLTDELSRGKIILAKPCMTDDPQPFRIYRIGKTNHGKIKVYARHISYDLSGVPVKPFSATSASDFAAKLKSNLVLESPFTFSTDLTTTENVAIPQPVSARSLLGGEDNTWQGAYGGEYRFDGYRVELLKAAGQNRGVVFEYGVDIVDLAQEENIEEMYTGILPYYQEEIDDNTVTVLGDILYASGNFEVQKILNVDITEYVQSNPTKAQVNAVGSKWMADNKIGKPTVSLTVKYAQIDQIVRLHDTVGVLFIKLGISENAQVTRTSYNVLKDRYSTVEVGDVRPTLGDNVHDASKLKKGLLPVERIKNNSIDGDEKLKRGSVSGSGSGGGHGGGGGGAIKKSSISSNELDDGSVTVTKIVDGAVVTTKIASGAVTGNKVLDQAIAYAKLSGNLQVFYNDTIAANVVFSEVIYAQKSVSCSTLIVDGTQFVNGTIAFIDGNGNTRSFSVLKVAGT